MFSNRPSKLDSDINYINLSRLTNSFSRPLEDVPPSVESLPAEFSTDEDEEEEIEEESKTLTEIKYKNGLWGIHRFDRIPWFRKERPFKRAYHYGSLKLTPKEKEGVLTTRIIACGLSYLERSPYDGQYALCKCQLPDKGLIDISALRPYHYLQYLDLSHNNITKLDALSEMPFLQYLDVSHNYIETAFDFAPPLYLTYVNYTNNKIQRMPYLGAYWSITYLNMSYNCIREIKGLESSKYLRELDLSYNNIKFLQNLNNLRISKLIISHNVLSMVENEAGDCGLKTLRDLDTIDLSYNDLTSLNFLLYNERLKCINISNNQINDLLEIYYLRFMQELTTLNLENNKLCENNHFKTMCLRILRSLTNLNGKAVIAEDRVMALDVDPQTQAHENKMQLLLLEYLNRPKIGAHLCPYGEPAPSIIVFCGPPASGKKLLAKKFIAHSEFLQRGIIYTTRDKRRNEVDGNEYYFISRDKFIKMIREAEFLTVTEFNGYLYGIALSELEKATNSILVFSSDFETGLILKMSGLNPTIILALPRNENTHITWIKETYFFDSASCVDPQELKITPVPTVIKLTDEAEADAANFTFETEAEDDQSDDTQSTIADEEISQEHILSPDEEVQSQKIPIEAFQRIDSLPNKNSDRFLQRQIRKSVLRQTKMFINWKNYEDSMRGTDGSIPEHISSQLKEDVSTKLDQDIVHNIEPHEGAKVEESPINIASIIEKKIESIIEDNHQNSEHSKSEHKEVEHSKSEHGDEKPRKAVELNIDDSKDLESVASESIFTTPFFLTVRTSESIRLIEAKRASIVPYNSTLEELRIEQLEPDFADMEIEINNVPEEDTHGIIKKDTYEQLIGKVEDNNLTAVSSITSVDSTFLLETPSDIGNERKDSVESSSSDRERSETKRVAFSGPKLQNEEFLSFDPSFIDQTHTQTLKSISYTHVLRSLQQHLMDNPLLSVLSASQMYLSGDGDETRRRNTAYTTLEERFDALKSDKLAPFITRILDSRKDMLELHYANPGLFRTVIFTDDKITDCMKVLKKVLKHLVKTRSVSITKDSWEDTPEFKTFINNKLKDLKILENRYTMFS